MKIKHLLTKTLLVAAGLLVGQSVWADETALNPVGVFTWTNAPAITYDGAATSWAINQGGISGGKLGKYAGPYAIVKFDATSTLAEKTLLSAKLEFDITAGTYNSSINIAQLDDASFDPATVTTETFDATAAQFQSGDWSTKNTTTHFSYDVIERVEANKVIAFAIYTNTGREQTLKDVKLTLEYSSGPVAKYDYTLKAVKEDDSEIKVLASGDEFEGKTVTAYFPYMFYDASTLYKTAATPYSVTFDKDNTTRTVTYTEASSDIVAYMEGESVNAVSGFNATYSNGQAGYVGGNKAQTLATLPAGKYTATIYLAGNGNRSIVIRNTANADNNSNTIISLPINKTSPAGLYTSDEFELLESTTISFTGYTTGDKTNQSADIDYIYVTRTGDATIPVEIKTTGTTFSSAYAIDCDNLPSGVTAYKVTKMTASQVTAVEVSGKVAANTGLILKATAADNYNIPVAATGEAVDGNLLKAAVTATPVAADESYGLKDGKFHKLNAGTIPANKAYLPATAVSAPELTIVFGGEATGISEIKTMRNAENEIFFDLQGRKVAQPAKGLYIQNGRKVILK